MPNQLKVVTYTNLNVIQCLETLLEQARMGKITGICYVVKHAPYHHSMGVVGRYLENPISGKRMAEKLVNVLECRAQSMETWG